VSEKVRRVQRLLAKLGYSPGPADGIWGPRTKRAIEHFQRDTGSTITGHADAQLIAKLEASLYSRRKQTDTQEPAGLISILTIIIFAMIAIAAITIAFVSSQRERKPFDGPPDAERKSSFQEAKTADRVPDAEWESSLQEAKVHHVIDGDTVIVYKSWREIRIRLASASIDCPEEDQDWGDIAKYGLIKLIGGRRILFEEHCQDQYGRIVATIYVQHGDEAQWMNVNARMVTLGHAWVRRDFDGNLPKERQDELYRLQRWARTKKVGLWNSADPVPPWKWRGGAKDVVLATIVSVRGATDITVRLPDGEEIVAMLDAIALRNRHGRIYGVNIGGSVEVVLDSPARIVGIDQTD
jgi:endonuclease YncB( thermonuclease family)